MSSPDDHMNNFSNILDSPFLTSSDSNTITSKKKNINRFGRVPSSILSFSNTIPIRTVNNNDKKYVSTSLEEDSIVNNMLDQRCSKSWDNTMVNPSKQYVEDDFMKTEWRKEKKSRKHIDMADVECILCFRLLYQPITTICGHTYCKNCIFASIKINPFCPLCRKPLCQNKFEFECSINYVLAGIIEKHFKEEYEERMNEEKGVKITFPNDHTNESNDRIPTIQIRRNRENNRTRRRSSSWWNDNIIQNCIFYPCDM